MFEQLVNPVIDHGMEIIMALLDAGADIKAHNPEGFTPLMVAALDTENPDVSSPYWTPVLMEKLVMKTTRLRLTGHKKTNISRELMHIYG